MSKVAHYLQEHVIGEVITSNDARKYYSSDNSVLSVVPAMVLYPRNEKDVRKTARFAWQLAERGRIIPITPRGMGADQSGAAVGSGIIMSMPAHLNKILDFDSKRNLVTVEPGVNYGKLQQALETNDRFVGAYPSSADFSTIGGAIANNATGEKSFKYGDTRSLVKKLKVVLANGEVIETGPLAKHDLNKKLGLVTFEGEIYRSLDKLLEENQELLDGHPSRSTKNAGGYDLWDIRHKSGTFDLTPLFVGSQGTLGIITEAVITTAVFNPETTLMAAFFNDLNVLQQVLMELNAQHEKPSSVELVDGSLLNFLHETNPNLLKGSVEHPFPEAMLLIECDDNPRSQKKTAHKITKILSHHQVTYRTLNDEKTRELVTKIRDAVVAVIAHSEGDAKGMPVVGGGSVPLDKFKDYLEGFRKLLKANSLKPAIWGRAGDGILEAQPCLDLSQVGDRQKVFKLQDEYSKLVVSLGGSICASHSDGRLHAPYMHLEVGKEVYELFAKVKEIFDPYNILNPGVKVDLKVDDIKPLLRYEYSLEHLYDFLPRG